MLRLCFSHFGVFRRVFLLSISAFHLRVHHAEMAQHTLDIFYFDGTLSVTPSLPRPEAIMCVSSYPPATPCHARHAVSCASASMCDIYLQLAADFIRARRVVCRPHEKPSKGCRCGGRWQQAEGSGQRDALRRLRMPFRGSSTSSCGHCGKSKCAN